MEVQRCTIGQIVFYGITLEGFNTPSIKITLHSNQFVLFKLLIILKNERFNNITAKMPFARSIANHSNRHFYS